MTHFFHSCGVELHIYISKHILGPMPQLTQKLSLRLFDDGVTHCLRPLLLLAHRPRSKFIKITTQPKLVLFLSSDKQDIVSCLLKLEL
jgi:hypothetical protein